MFSIKKLLIALLFISIVPAPMMAMEEQPIAFVREKKRVPALARELRIVVIQAVRVAFEQMDFEPLRKLLEKGVRASQIYLISFECLPWQPIIERDIDIPDSFTSKFLSLLCEYKFDVNEITAQEFSFLNHAILSQLPKLARFLIDQGADIQVIEGEFTPLMRAIRMGYFDLAHYLIEKGADINVLDPLGMTALDCVFEKFKKPALPLIPLMIERGAVVDARHLIATIASGEISLFELLLKNGANPNLIPQQAVINGEVAINPGKVTLLHYVCMKQYLASFVSHYAERERRPLGEMDQVCKYDLPCMQLLFDYGANNLNERDAHGATALMIAAGFFPQLEQTIEAQFGIEIQITREEACKNLNMKPFAQLLLAHGANRDLKNNAGQTARDIALECGNEEMVKLLDTYHPWGTENSNECLKLRAAKAVLAECKKMIANETMNADELKQLIQDMPDSIRGVMCFIAPKEVKDILPIELLLPSADLGAVQKIEPANTQNSNNE